MAKKFIEGTELVEPGFANGISTQLYKKQLEEGPEARLTDAEKEAIIKKDFRFQQQTTFIDFFSQARNNYQDTH